MLMDEGAGDGEEGAGEGGRRGEVRGRGGGGSPSEEEDVEERQGGRGAGCGPSSSSSTLELLTSMIGSCRCLGVDVPLKSTSDRFRGFRLGRLRCRLPWLGLEWDEWAVLELSSE